MQRLFLSLFLCLDLSSGVLAQGQAGLSILAPSTPGGGWDVLARTLADALKATGITTSVNVYNIGGKAGTVGLADFVKFKGQPGKLMVTGFVMVAGIPVNNSPFIISRDTTPIAGLVSANEVLIVSATSPYRTVDDLISALRNNPGSVRFGGSSLGGTSHVAFATIAKELGVPARNMKYIPSAGGLQAAKAMLSGNVDVVSTGYSEVDELITAKSVRVLAVLSDERLPGIDAPTLKEKGLDVDVANWRGIVAPPGISETEKNNLERKIQRLTKSDQWQNALKANKWNENYMNSGVFKRYIQLQEHQLPQLLKELDLIK